MSESPGGMYWQNPEEFTSTLVWNVASNLSSALHGEKCVCFNFFFFLAIISNKCRFPLWIWQSNREKNYTVKQITQNFFQEQKPHPRHKCHWPLSSERKRKSLKYLRIKWNNYHYRDWMLFISKYNFMQKKHEIVHCFVLGIKPIVFGALMRLSGSSI